MTERVKNVFLETFKEAGLVWNKIYVGNFTDVG